MDKTRVVAAVAVIAAAAILATLFNQGNLSGLFGLQAEEIQAEESLAEEIGQTEEEAIMNAGLSFEVLEPTRLEASVLGEKIAECPGETQTEILVKNSGGGLAEKVFLEFGPGIKVLGCSNCFLEELRQGQEVVAKARICLETEAVHRLTVGSANSRPVELLFEE